MASIRRNAFLLITEHAAPFLSGLPKSNISEERKIGFHDAPASHAQILCAMLSSLDVPSFDRKWSEDKKIGTFMGGVAFEIRRIM